ncbi:MAG: hypothetical protein ACO3JL_12570 [Myxococcota bacterium]
MHPLPPSTRQRILTLLDAVTLTTVSLDFDRALQATLEEQLMLVFDCLWCLETCWMAVAARRELRASLEGLAALMEGARLDTCLDEEGSAVWSTLVTDLQDVRAALEPRW